MAFILSDMLVVRGDSEVVVITLCHSLSHLIVSFF